MEIVYAAFVATSLTGRSNDRNRSRGISSNRISRLQSPKFVDIRCGRTNDCSLSFYFDCVQYLIERVNVNWWLFRTTGEIS